jgi:hypothetical protein
MSSTENQQKIGLSLIGAAVVVMICLIVTLAGFAIVSAQVSLPGVVQHHTAQALDASLHSA